MSMIAVAAPDVSVPASARDRRSHPRVSPDELSWIREVRLKYGPRVSLVDLSDGGALVQTDVRLRPGAELVIEIVGAQVHAVPFRVLRSELARISGDSAIYQGACEFKRPLNLAEAAASATRTTRCDVALKSLLDRRRNESSINGGAGAYRAPGDLPQLLKAVQASARADDPLSRSLQDILSDVVPALTRASPLRCCGRSSRDASGAPSLKSGSRLDLLRSKPPQALKPFISGRRAAAGPAF